MTIKLPDNMIELATRLLHEFVRMWQVKRGDDPAADEVGVYITADLGPLIWRGEIALLDEHQHTRYRRVYG